MLRGAAQVIASVRPSGDSARPDGADGSGKRRRTPPSAESSITAPPVAHATHSVRPSRAATIAVGDKGVSVLHPASNVIPSHTNSPPSAEVGAGSRRGIMDGVADRAPSPGHRRQ